jgi:hypothetical protein
MPSDLFKRAKQDVGKIFRTPEDVGKAEGLSDEEKVELLKQWEIDLRLLMVASDENMAGTSPGQAADFLQRIRAQLAELGATEHEPAAVNKAGG